MKDVINNRIKRIEELLKRENVVCLVAMHDEEGFHWNGKTYSDKTELSVAVNLVAYNTDKPLVIISKVRLSENLH